MTSLRDRVAVITGASRGIGRAIALGLALAPDDGDALAQRAIIRIARNDVPGGLSDSARAIEASPTSSATDRLSTDTGARPVGDARTARTLLGDPAAVVRAAADAMGSRALRVLAIAVARDSAIDVQAGFGALRGRGFAGRDEGEPPGGGVVEAGVGEVLPVAAHVLEEPDAGAVGGDQLGGEVGDPRGGGGQPHR